MYQATQDFSPSTRENEAAGISEKPQEAVKLSHSSHSLQEHKILHQHCLLKICLINI